MQRQSEVDTTKKKSAWEMTDDELAREVFPPEVIEAVKATTQGTCAKELRESTTRSE